MTLHAYLGLLGEGMHCNLDPKVLIRVHPLCRFPRETEAA